MTGSSGDLGSTPVTIIDSSKSGADLSFKFSEVQVQPPTRTIPLSGTCDESQDGAIFGWVINAVNPDNSVGPQIASGQSICEAGSFSVELPTDDVLDCNSTYRVSARLGFGQPAVSLLTKSCR